MPVDYVSFSKKKVNDPRAHLEVRRIAEALRDHLNEAPVQAKLKARNVLGASSFQIQDVILAKARELGFQDEKRGLFEKYRVQGLRPDYFRPVRNTGIILEVERGKTITNNMDLLDLWKCHICREASYLFLMVPKARPSARGTFMRHFKIASNRLCTFFERNNYVNVDAVYLFGY